MVPASPRTFRTPIVWLQINLFCNKISSISSLTHCYYYIYKKSRHFNYLLISFPHVLTQDTWWGENEKHQHRSNDIHGGKTFAHCKAICQAPPFGRDYRPDRWFQDGAFTRPGRFGYGSGYLVRVNATLPVDRIRNSVLSISDSCFIPQWISPFSALALVQESRRKGDAISDRVHWTTTALESQPVKEPCEPSAFPCGITSTTAPSFVNMSLGFRQAIRVATTISR